MPSPRAILSVALPVIAVVTGWYQYSLKPELTTLGYGRVVEAIGNSDCQTYPELEACEKLMLHQPTGLLYLACSNLVGRVNWTPAMGRLNASGGSTTDYIATFDPSTSKVQRLKIVGDDRGIFGSVGLDIVPSADDPSQLWVYTISHYPPRAPLQASVVGPTSVVIVYKTGVGSDTLTHVKTWEDPIISTPNDISGSDTGDSFHFTNDHGTRKIGIMRDLFLDAWFKLAWGNVAYCHLDTGCRVVHDRLLDPNGIVSDLSRKEVLYAASSKFGIVYVFKKHVNGDITLVDTIETDRATDNLSVDNEGSVWTASFPNALHFGMVHWENISIPSPSSSLRITKTGSPSPRYKVEKLFEDDGNLASGATTVAYDSVRNLIFLNSVTAPHLTVCKLDV